MTENSKQVWETAFTDEGSKAEGKLRIALLTSGPKDITANTAAVVLALQNSGIDVEKIDPSTLADAGDNNRVILGSRPVREAVRLEMAIRREQAWRDYNNGMITQNQLKRAIGETALPHLSLTTKSKKKSSATVVIRNVTGDPNYKRPTKAEKKRAKKEKQRHS